MGVVSWRGTENAVVTPPPPIPFHTARARHPVPPALSFGFGCSGAYAEAGPSTPQDTVPGPSRTTEWQARSLSKRRRSSSDVDVDDEPETEVMDELPKRRRPVRSASSDPSPRRATGGDLGRWLATLDKPALLGMLLELAKDAPTAERMYTLLPTPSVDDALAALHSLEIRLRQMLPTSALPGQVREQYVLSRVRSCLVELYAALMQYMPLFSLASRDEAREPIHPTTTFAFLLGATQCMLRVAHALPSDEVLGKVHIHDTLLSTYTASAPASRNAADTLAHAIFPALLREWTVWLITVDVQVNQEARMYGQDVVQTWARGLAQLRSPSSSHGTTEAAMHVAMEQAASQMHSSIGWLAGPSHRPTWHSSSHAHAMDEGDAV